jgi:ankyrin repeat protein
MPFFQRESKVRNTSLKKHHLSVMKLLLERGANIDALWMNRTALHEAAGQGYEAHGITTDRGGNRHSGKG